MPPYPEPKDQMARSSGNCTMYLVSLHGQATSASPSASGWPTEWMAWTKPASVSVILSRTAEPMRAMTRMETVT